MASRMVLPDVFRSRIEDYEAGRLVPSTPKPAATVVILRDHAEHGLQVFMLRRVQAMAFAPGAYVFPGGAVDTRDAEAAIGWVGPSTGEWGAALHADEAEAGALVCAAVRETFEETLVLLAGPTADSVVADTRGADWEADRQALLDRSLSLTGFLARRGLVLRSDLLRPWAHWITPVVETPRRYDTRFFVAAIPAGQQARDVSTEADRATWVRPADVLAAAERGDWLLLPPTLAALRDLVGYRTVAEVLAAERDIPVIEPRAELVDGIPYLVVG